MVVSIIIPVYNEHESINILVDSLLKVVQSITNIHLEIIFIDDASSDNSGDIIKQKIAENNNIKGIFFKRNFGQTAAISAGIENATGDIIIPMDADLQNDPADIPKLIQKLEEGYDVVSGWRQNRKDYYFSRILPSRVANWVISFISGVTLHDYGCSLKVYRREILDNINLYGEMHRFIPIYVAWQGGKVTEIPVNHFTRKYGKSKYGIMRTFSVISDLIFLKYMEKQFAHPIHMFGGFALVNFGLSLLSFLLMIYFKFWGGKSFIQTPLPQLVILFVLVGILCLFMGLLAEILMRTYFESQDKKAYQIREILNSKEL